MPDKWYSSIEEKNREDIETYSGDIETALADSATAISDSSQAVSDAGTALSGIGTLRGELETNAINTRKVMVESVETANGILDTFTFTGITSFVVGSEEIVNNKEVWERTVDYVPNGGAGNVVFNPGHLPSAGKVYISCEVPTEWVAE